MKYLGSYKKLFTSEEIISFCALTGDTNPIHTNNGFAKDSGFDGCVVNGALGLSFAISFLIEKLDNSEGVVIFESRSLYKKPVIVDTELYFHIVEEMLGLGGSVGTYVVYLSPQETLDPQKLGIYFHKHSISLKFA